GEVYSWHSSKSIATILLKTSNKEKAILYLKSKFNSLKNKNFEHYYELANFYKDNKYYEESIEYYSLTLNKINKNHFLVSKILDRRGSSYEKIGKWTNAEKDLQESLKVSPDQAYVLNYLAYSWIEKKMNIKKSLKMLKQADSLKKDDPYITDSLGWAHFMNKNYNEAEKYLQRAVILMPYDPVINDHYADVLWMLNKKIQARYFWKHAINVKNIKKELKDSVSKKIFFGIPEKL
ncbi:tetratricopeptide repeat protein, partial [Pelagibacteraceae bacterium]|nr:tetratricopeptide repeat protein [Pelagibacteraceae bacterium]